MFNKYPYTDFHELNLDWFLNQFKELVSDWDTFKTDLTEQWEQVSTDWQTLYNYVHDYFNNLDVQTEIDNKLDEMVADGTLDALIQPYIDEYTNDIRVLEARMDTFASLPDGSTAGDAELLDIRVGADGTTYATAGDAVRGQVTDLKEELSDITTNGMNLFDSSQILQNKVVDLTGSERTSNDFYCTPFIPVAPSTAYKIYDGLGSSSAYLTCAFYDANKEFIEGSFNPSTSAYTVTTPDNCAYIRVNGALVRLENQSIIMSNAVYNNPYRLILNGQTERGVFLVSEREIFYDGTTGILSSTVNMYVFTPDNAYILGQSINVGTGAYLYFDKNTGTLLTDTLRFEENLYLLGLLHGPRQFSPEKNFVAINSAFPIFKFDLHNNSLKIESKGQPTYIIYNGIYYTIPTDFTQELTLPTHCAICFDPIASNFKVISDFGINNLNSGIVVAVRLYTQITCIADYETVIYDDSYKRFVCYGDSLTYYDGNAFTWGDHQGETCVGFETYLRQELQARVVTNRGRSGWTTPQFCELIRGATDLSNYDIITIMGGDNDDRLSGEVGAVLPVGSTFDTTTVCGALQSAIEYVLAQNPAIKIILMTEPMGWTYRNNQMERVNEAIPQAYRDVAKIYGVALIDFWSMSGINELTRATYYADPTTNHLYMYHPNNDGWIRISKILCNEIKKYI